MMLLIDKELIFFALLTAVIELPLFYWCGYRTKQQLTAFLGANIISNLLLNEALPVYSPTAGYWLTLAAGELLVVLVEFYLMDYVAAGGRRLLRTVCITNAASLLIGLLMFFT